MVHTYQSFYFILQPQKSTMHVYNHDNIIVWFKAVLWCTVFKCMDNTLPVKPVNSNWLFQMLSVLITTYVTGRHLFSYIRYMYDFSDNFNHKVTPPAGLE